MPGFSSEGNSLARATPETKVLTAATISEALSVVRARFSILRFIAHRLLEVAVMG